MFDLASIAVVDTSILHLKGPDDELLYFVEGEGVRHPVRAVLYGPGSKQYNTAQSARQSKAIARLQKKGSATASTGEQNADQVDFLTAITVRFENLVYSKAPGATGEALHRAIYADPTVGFIGEQVAKHTGDWANFTKGSATS